MTQPIDKNLDQLILLVNEEDHKVGSCEKLYVHQKGYLHRAFSVFIMNDEGKMLLQKRADHKYHSGGLWTNACCSHQLGNVDLRLDIENRLDYELGIRVKNLRERFIYSYRADLDHGLIENEVDHIYTATYKGEVTFNKDEVSEIKWVDPTWLLNDIKGNPDRYTYWFKGTIERVLTFV